MGRPRVEVGCPLQATCLDTPESPAPSHYFASRGGHHLVTLEPSFSWYILLGESSLEPELFSAHHTLVNGCSLRILCSQSLRAGYREGSPEYLAVFHSGFRFHIGLSTENVNIGNPSGCDQFEIALCPYS